MHPLDADHVMRLVRAGDGEALARAYHANRVHLAPWEPLRSEDFFTSEQQENHVEQCLADLATGRGYRFVIESDDGEIRGRINLNNVVRGAFRSADLGYWIDATRTGRGLAARGVEIAIGFARTDLDLHRVQAATLVHNRASQGVLMSAGFERIGLAPRYLRIAGEWQDHELFQRILA